jgi:hypothetical protein
MKGIRRIAPMRIACLVRICPLPLRTISTAPRPLHCSHSRWHSWSRNFDRLKIRILCRKILGRSCCCTRGSENAANYCGVRLFDGGHERSRTSDPYSVNLKKTLQQAQSRAIEDEVTTLKTIVSQKIGYHRRYQIQTFVGRWTLSTTAAATMRAASVGSYAPSATRSAPLLFV